MVMRSSYRASFIKLSTFIMTLIALTVHFSYYGVFDHLSRVLDGEVTPDKSLLIGALLLVSLIGVLQALLCTYIDEKL